MDRSGDARFECLRCGKVSQIERIEALQPRCAKCGSGTGLLGDIGQGSVQDRLRSQGVTRDPGYDNVNFECLRCGTVTLVRKMAVVRPGCMHCGARDGVVVNGG